MGWLKKNSPLDDLDDSQPQPAARPVAAKPAAAKPAAKAAAKPAAKPSAKSGFGIEKAIELMRNLPDDNESLVVAVVRTTLESANVSVEAIIDDAELKQARIENRVDSLKKEIKDYEEEIAARKEEIGRLDADNRETAEVRKKLELSLMPAASDTPAPSKPVRKTEPMGLNVQKTGSHALVAPKAGSLPGVKPS